MTGVRLKPLNRQTIVITGASSGIGLATARMAARRGAAVVLVARNEDALRDLTEEIRSRGGRAEYVAADVADRDAMERVARRAQEAFGGFDSWVNDAGATVYGPLEQISEADHRRLFDTNYWGVVNGSLIAARELRSRGGAIINIGSVLSDRAMIDQAAYSATKQAVKAFTEGLRMELERDGAPVSVTLIKPGPTDTPYQEHAKNYLPSAGVRVPPPAYDPRLSARAILYACEHPKREIVVGFGGYAVSLLGSLFPRTTDRVMERIGRQAQVTDKAPRADRVDNLHQPRADGTERSLTRPTWPYRRSSLLLEAQLHPVLTVAAVAGLGALALGASATRRVADGRARITDGTQHRWPRLQDSLSRMAERPRETGERTARLDGRSGRHARHDGHGEQRVERLGRELSRLGEDMRRRASRYL